MSPDGPYMVNGSCSPVRGGRSPNGLGPTYWFRRNQWDGHQPISSRETNSSVIRPKEYRATLGGTMEHTNTDYKGLGIPARDAIRK